MKIVNIKFTTDKYHQDDEIDDFIDNLINDMRNQGRITGKPLSLLEKDKSFVLNCRVPEDTSLNVIVENHWFKELENKNIKITYSVLGEDVWSPDICGCKKSKFYILSGSRPIPLLCGDCMNSIPLYKLPFTYISDPSYYDIVSWNNENKAWGTIEFSSLAKIEEIAQHELCDCKSEHTITALQICEIIKGKTNIDCYYDLENLRDESKIESEISKKCPKCNGDWILKEQLHDIYDFKCNICHLISNFSYNIQAECSEYITKKWNK